MSAMPPPPAYQQPTETAGGEPPLWAPYYGITLPGAIRRYFKKYADFSGRASRSEYWWYVLAYAVVQIILGILTQSTSGSGHSVSAGGIIFGIISVIVSLGTIVPTLAITWRRLHDANLAGPFYFLNFTGIGGIVVLIMTILRSKPEGQRFDRPRP